jgi:hypothetical protein
MTETDAKRFHREQDDCLRQAETAVNPLDVQWSRMVREWTGLAKDSEQRRQLSGRTRAPQRDWIIV